MDTPSRIGIDLGGTKIELVVLDASGRARIRRRVDTPASDYGAIVEAIGALVDGAARGLGPPARTGGARLAAEEIATRAAGRDAGCEATIARYEARLARSLAGVINVLDPDVIVLGGGLSRIARLYDHVPARWGEHVFCDEVRTRLAPALHGDASGVRGAAWLWEQRA